MKLRADQKPAQHRAEVHAQVGMQQAFDQLLACHSGHELRWPHAQQQAGNEEEAVVEQVVKQVRARV